MQVDDLNAQQVVNLKIIVNVTINKPVLKEDFL